jgi:putative addiction module component (TIGR02574 family)
MEYIVKITDNSLKAKNIINLLKSLAEDYDFLEFLSSTDNLFELTEEQQQELDRRFEHVKKNPNEGKTWEEIEAKLLSK